MDLGYGERDVRQTIGAEGRGVKGGYREASKRVQRAGPVEETAVSGQQLVTLERRGDDEAVRRVAVHVRQQTRADRDAAVYGNLA